MRELIHRPAAQRLAGRGLRRLQQRVAVLVTRTRDQPVSGQQQGAVNPSVGTLLRISDALGVGLPALVELPAPKPVKVTRHGHGAVLWSGESGGRGVLVAGTAPPDVVELWDWTLGPGDQHSSEAHTPGTKELVQVQQGTVTVEVAGEPVVLAAGDAVTFPGDVAHGYANPGPQPARFSLAVFEPGVGSGSHSEVADA